MYESDSHFTVTLPKIIYQLALVLLGIFVAIPVIDTIANGPNIVEYVSIALFCYLPLIPTLLWGLLFKVSVNDRRITVRRGCGIQYCFDVSEITRVEWKSVDSSLGRNEIVKIRVGCRRISIETLMPGSEKMIQYLKDRVPRSKIIESRRSIRAK